MDENKQDAFRTLRGYELSNLAKNSLTSAMEDYLEMIARLCAQTGVTRVGKLSASLQVQPPSASKMVKKLTALGLVHSVGPERIGLTTTGQEQANWLLYRHEMLEQFLKFLDCSNPLEETELLEHWISPETVHRIELMLQFFSTYPDVQALFDEFIQQSL